MQHGINSCLPALRRKVGVDVDELTITCDNLEIEFSGVHRNDPYPPYPLRRAACRSKLILWS